MPRPSAPSAETRLRERALEIGFERVGIARAGRSRDAGRLDAWLDAGNEADLAYMRRDPARRADPRQVLAGCRSVIVGTVAHFWPDPPSEAEMPARVARYARGRDYHRILRGMLKALCAALDELSPDQSPRHRWYVDTGPVLERAWAAEAGVGFTGKNACLIDPRRGSWSTLGVVLTTLELVPDTPVEVGCGTCARCLDACPTGAITAPGVVDSRLCISYWTIEHRGAIPEEVRPGVGTRVFGCDDCQDVCPWNRFARPATVADHRPRELFADADLARLARLDERAWDEATRGTAVRRAGYAGLLRNVAVALGNTGDERARPLLHELAEHPHDLVREHARWGLRRLDELGGAHEG
jgi:epoxyqueuosine reductase